MRAILQMIKTFHACDSSLEDSVNRLEYDANLVIEWFDCNYMKLIKNKCHVSISGHKSDTILNQTMQDIFEKRQNIDYNLRFQINFVLPGVNTTYFSLHSLRYFSSKIWTVIPDEIKNSTNRIYQPHRSRRGGGRRVRGQRQRLPPPKFSDNMPFFAKSCTF